MCEVAQGYPAYTLEVIQDMPSVDFAVMHSRLSVGEYRRHLPTAMLMAAIQNALGGKGGDGKPLPEHKRFDPHELLPPYAQPAALFRDLPFAADQCAAIMDAISDRELPGWAVQILSSIMPMSQIMRLGGTREVEGERDGFAAHADWNKADEQEYGEV